MTSTEWRRAHPNNARKHREAEKRRWREDPATRRRHRERGKTYRVTLKYETFEAYGGVCCACCDEDELSFLTLDHIYNDGAAQRKVLGAKGGGHQFYLWLKKQGYPPGYQVLCMNCNFGKQVNGGVCPHKLRGDSDE